MALEKVSTILKMADAANTSAIGFNCNDYTMAYSVVQVAEELNKPVIVMLYPPDNFESNCCGVAGFAATVRELASKVKVPIGLHLDHCSDFDYILRAMNWLTDFEGKRINVADPVLPTSALKPNAVMRVLWGILLIFVIPAATVALGAVTHYIRKQRTTA